MAMDPPPTPVLHADALGRDAVAAVRQFLEQKRRWFAESVERQRDALEICREHAAILDRAIQALFSHVERGHPAPGRLALLALGGFGRREMGLFCDIDLLFLHETRDGDYLRGITDGILYPLWDSGVEVGGATRTVADCREIIGKEIKAFTAMTEARLICGDPSLFDEMDAMVARRLADPSIGRRFIETKMQEMRERLARFGDSLYLLQPNVKEGEGGLRDHQTLVWIARAAFGGSAEEALAQAVPSADGRRAIEEAHRFLWRVRHALHLIEGKRADQLTDALQPAVAAMLGFADAEGTSAAEALMASYYRHAIGLHVQCERAAERIRRRANPPGRAARLLRRRRLGRGFLRTEYQTLAVRDEGVWSDPVSVLRIFAVAKRHHLPLDAEAKEQVASRAPPVDSAVRAGSAAGAVWREIFSSLEGLDRTLAELMECGQLGRWFPEMEAMFHHVQHDGFHFYTTGVHSIRAVAELSALSQRRARERFPVEAGAMTFVERPAVLAIATLFHDVGKGQGSDHAARGAALVRPIALRLGFSPQDADDIAFLVRSHLQMTMLAFRRDVRDPGLIDRFAPSLRSPEMLSMLYLLTVADLRAIGPHVWSDWKGGLLAELYQRTRDHFEAAGRSPEAHRREEARHIAAVRQSLGRDCAEEDVRAFLGRLPERYRSSIGPETIAAHLTMVRGIAAHPVATAKRPVPERGCTEFSVVTPDRPGLFAQIAGVLTANGANIIDAQLFTSADGIAIDVFWMTDAAGEPLADPEQWTRIRAEMEAVISGREEIEQIVGQRFKRRLLSWGQRHRPPEILVDNDVSALETVVEVSADDRRGLLYTIASAFRDLGCSIERARITTHIDRVIDVFYIRDAGGGKIVDRERLEGIRRELFGVLED